MRWVKWMWSLLPLLLEISMAQHHRYHERAVPHAVVQLVVVCLELVVDARESIACDGTVWFGVVLCSKVWYSVAWCGVVWCGVVWRCVAWCCIVLCCVA